MSETFEEWAILELMGHRRLAGLVKEETLGAASFIRIDVPDGDGGFSATQYYNPAAVYCMTPTTKEMAEQVAAQNSPEPVSRWELPAPDPDPDEKVMEDTGDHYLCTQCKEIIKGKVLLYSTGEAYHYPSCEDPE